jgi:hypothetical protein
MPFDATDLATRLLSRELTPERLLKLRRHLARDPWVNPPVVESAKVSALLDAIEQHPNGGANTRAFVHDALVNQPTRTIPPLPADIAKKVEAFQRERATRQAARR